ncbi:MAG: CHAT domain-containing protein, partial [Anaerolineae bacterium]|nr:CHAT domain-containing protein [Anaerolineae bacterium]
MAVTITLSIADGSVVAAHAGRPLTDGVALDTLPRITANSNPYRLDPAGLGARLYAALGGPTLTDLLDADDEGLLLVADDAAAGLPWEYAATLDGDFLVCRYRFLRVLPDIRPSRPAPAGPLSFIALMADPLVRDDKARTPRDGYKLDIENEIAAIGKVLRASHVALHAQRIPPTKAHLQRALRHGPAILHLSCHGNVIPVEANGRKQARAILDLEDVDGVADPLAGPTFTSLPPAGVLRLVMMSACRTAASAMDASLARSLVAAGIPAAIGMQGDFPDPLSDELAATLYEFLLAGHDLGEALRQARVALAEHPYAVGLPVAYVAPGAAGPLPLQSGQPAVPDLSQGRYLNLPLSLQPPHPFLGRERELYELAHAFSTGHKVVTVVGTGGIGKTALAAAFAERFGWRFAGGVIGFSLVDLPDLGAEALFRALMERLVGLQAATALADRPAEALAEAFIAAGRERPPLLLLDNYESVLQALAVAPSESETAGAPAAPLHDGDTGLTATQATALRELLAERFNLEELRTLAADTGVDYDELGGEGKTARARELIALLERRGGIPDLIRAGRRARPDVPWGEFLGAQATDESLHAAAERLHRLVTSLAQAGLSLLLTSRQQPAGLPGEVVFPRNGALAGIADAAGADLFIHHSTRAQAEPGLHAALALHVAQATEGHPLAIALLAGEFDASREVTPEVFLAGWDEELAAARRPGMARHQVTFDAAFGRSFRALSETEQMRLTDLSRLNLPFFAEAAACLWTGAVPAGAAGLAPFAAVLDSFAGRSLARVDSTFTGTDRAATYRLEPVIGRTLRRRRPAEREAALDRGYAAYAHWLVDRAFGETGRDPGMASLIQGWGDELIGQAESQPAEARARYCWQLGVTLYGFGRLADDEKLLELGAQAATAQGDEAILARIFHAQASAKVVRGDLNRALTLYEQALALDEKLGELGEKAATLHNMAQVYLTRGDLDQAMRLYQQSLAQSE